MKFIKPAIILLFGVTVLATTPCPTFAVDSSSSADPSGKDKIKAMREETKDKIQQARDDLKTKIAQDKEAFRQKLQGIKDEKKKQIVDNLTTRLATVNKNQTDRMLRALNEMSAHLQKISSNSAAAKANGKDTTSVDIAIAAAQDAINAARTAVTTQAGKTYIPTITTDTDLRTTVGTTIKQLQADLKETRTTVLNARKGVANAAVALAKVRGERKTATSSANKQ